MGKKILFSVSIILILSSVGIFFLFNDFIEKAEKKDTGNDVVVEENQELDDEKNVEKEQETETSEIIDEIEENTGESNETIQENTQEKNSNIQKNESNQPVKTEQNDEKNQVQEEKQESIIIDVPKEEQPPLIDKELEKLKKQVEYATYEECQKAGFEKAFSDTVNILGFSCQEVIYKGKVLGYKLHIDYTNPME